MDFYGCLKSAKKETFRLEMRDEYRVKEEDRELEIWRNTGKFEPGEGGKQWARDLEALRARGVITHRVHVVTVPLSDYLRFEIAAYAEDVNYIERDDYAGIKKPFEPQEFWLIDEKHLFIVKYDQEGHWLGNNYTDDAKIVERHAMMKDLLISKALPLEEFAKKNRISL
jgi:hypothetical protein